MANILSAIGGAAPALTAEWRALQAEERENRLAKQQEAMLPLKMEEAQQQIAINRETYAKMQMERQQKQKAQQQLETPTNANEWLDSLKFDPDIKSPLKGYYKAVGIPDNGQTTVENVGKLLDHLIKTQALPNAIKSQLASDTARVATAREEYNEAKLKPGFDPVKLDKLYQNVKSIESNIQNMGRVDAKLTEHYRNVDSMVSQINQMQEDGTFGDLPPIIQSGLMTAARAGNTKEFTAIVNKYKENQNKGSDFQLVQDKNGNWVRVNKVTNETMDTGVTGVPKGVGGEQPSAIKEFETVTGIKPDQRGTPAYQQKYDEFVQKKKSSIGINQPTEVEADALAESIANDELSLSQVGKRGKNVAMIVGRVKEQYPNFNFGYNDANFRFKTSQINMRTVNFVGGALPRVSRLVQQVNELPNVTIPAINAAMRTFLKNMGLPEYTNFESNRNAIVQEINTGLSGSATGSDFRVRIELENLNSAMSPEQLKGAINNLNEALIARLEVDMSPLYPIEVVRGQKTMDQYKKELFDKYRKNFKPEGKGDEPGGGSPREKAIKFLQDAGEPVVEENIKAVIKNKGW